MFVGGKLRPDRAHEPENFAQAYLVNPQPISDNRTTKTRTRKKSMKKMEEEDDDEEDFIPFDAIDAVDERHEVESSAVCDPYNATAPHCVVCGRTPNPKVRLFKWPEDEQLRKSWLAFFHLDMDFLDDCKVPYICNTHFDANQFLYEGNRIFWKRDPFPRYRQRRSVLAEPFPWELEQNFEKKQPSESIRCVRLKHGATHGHKVTFRESFFKSKSKSSHPVAVVSLPENPNIFYEFSYTRTSTKDASKFYSCLTCRRAKTDTRVKDVIRTIHIKDGTIRSRGDPFWGHHFACRPFTSLATSSPVRPDTSQIDYVEYSGADEEFLREHDQAGSRWEEGCSSIEQTPFIAASSKIPELIGSGVKRNYLHESGSSASFVNSTPYSMKTSTAWFVKQVSSISEFTTLSPLSSSSAFNSTSRATFTAACKIHTKMSLLPNKNITGCSNTTTTEENMLVMSHKKV
ncbi:THAP domain protein [Ostertagia ostertagi]